MIISIIQFKGVLRIMTIRFEELQDSKRQKDFLLHRMLLQRESLLINIEYKLIFKTVYKYVEMNYPYNDLGIMEIKIDGTCGRHLRVLIILCKATNKV